MKYILPLILIVSCSTTKENVLRDRKESSLDNSFKKETAYSNSSIQDYYDNQLKTLNPALQDETIDRYNLSELSNIKSVSDPLLEISVKCRKNDYEAAFSTASLNFNRYQKVAAYWNQIANCHLMKGSFRKALLFYNKALEVSPNYVPALNNIGVMYSRQGLDQKALVAFERAYKQSKFTKTPRYNLARLYLTYGLVEAAVPIFQSLLNNSPNDVDILNALATAFFIQSDFQKAILYYKKIPQREWANPEIGLNISLVLKKSGKLEDAKKVFKMVRYPINENLKKYYASVKAQIGDA